MWYSAIRCLVTLTLGLFAAPLVAMAQPRAHVPRIEWLSSDFPPSDAALQRSSFPQGLRELGWVEGQNITIERRYAEENADRLPALAAELVQLRVDVIVSGDPHANTTIPIVMAMSARGYVASLAQPGGNITGLLEQYSDLVPKWLELLKDAVP